MSKIATREYMLRMRERYQGMKTKRAKGRVLDEFCACTGSSRKHSIKVLRSRKEPLRQSGRPAVYGEEPRQALTSIWLAAGQPCSKLMKPIMDCYVTSHERAHGPWEGRVRAQLLKMSESSMDRLLKPARIQHVGRRRRPTGLAAVKREVAIRAGVWQTLEAGWMESDTVAHCGGNMAGDFAWTLTLTDILTEWTEVRTTWNRGAAGVMARIREIEQVLPFPMKGFDSDNGPEFMNWQLLRYFRESTPAVVFTRSRPYMKNDNAHVEQKNGTHVRGLLGHDRIEDPDCIDDLNRVMAQWSLWKNLYSPARKLISKTRVGSRYRKVYDKAQTPAQRVLNCPSVSQAGKDWVRKQLASHDCFSLRHDVELALRNVFDSIKKRAKKHTPPSSPGYGTSALRAAPSGPVPPPGEEAKEPQSNPKRMVS